MADREQDALDCAARRREREANPPDPALYVCRCDHDHPPEVSWCDLCEYPVERVIDHGTCSSCGSKEFRLMPDRRIICADRDCYAFYGHWRQLPAAAAAAPGH